MSVPVKYLKVKTSTIPNAGKGLYVLADVPKGHIIIEYTGRRTTWALVEDDADNPYIYHIDDDNVIDAKKHLKSLGRYANDAAGFQKIKGITNNAEYYEEDKRVYIRAKKNIPAGSEVLVSYGKEYWKQSKENMKIDAQQKKQAGNKKK